MQHDLQGIVDFKTYEFVATQPGTTVHFARTDVAPGLKEPTDIVKAKGLVVGGLSVDTPKDLRLDCRDALHISLYR